MTTEASSTAELRGDAAAGGRSHHATGRGRRLLMKN
jgi:hypothetical protein